MLTLPHAYLSLCSSLIHSFSQPTYCSDLLQMVPTLFDAFVSYCLMPFYCFYLWVY